MERIKTHVHGAENVIRAALANQVKKFIALSTDQAASPINLYGPTQPVSDPQNALPPYRIDEIPRRRRACDIGAGDCLRGSDLT